MLSPEEIEIDITCISKCEVIKFIAEKEEEEVFILFYKSYEHQISWKKKFKDIWKILQGKPVLSNDMVVNKEELKNLNKIHEL